MNDKNSLNAEERALAEILTETALQVEVRASFQSELEKKLMNTHKPKTGFGLFSFGKTASIVGSALGLAVLALIFISPPLVARSAFAPFKRKPLSELRFISPN